MTLTTRVVTGPNKSNRIGCGFLVEGYSAGPFNDSHRKAQV